MATSTRPKDGTARADLFDPANPQVTLTLDAETAFKLRRFLKKSNIGEHTEGPDDALYSKVYRPLLEVEDSIRQSMLVHAERLAAEATHQRNEAHRLTQLSASLYRGSP